MFDKILVVCVGNICRSPFGERLLQKKLPHKTISSAGVGVKRSHLAGKPADKTAIEVAAVYGVDLIGHSAQQLTGELCSQYDLILAMEKGHIHAIADMAPEARGKVMLFGQWIEQQDISDPYKQSQEAFKFVYEQIDKAADAWVKKLR